MTPIVTRRGVGLVGTCAGATTAAATGFAALPAGIAGVLAAGLRAAGAAAVLRAGAVGLRIGAVLAGIGLRALFAAFLTITFFATGRRAGVAFFAEPRAGAGFAGLRAGTACPRATAFTFDTTFCINLPTTLFDEALRALAFGLAAGRAAGFDFFGAAFTGAFALRAGAGLAFPRAGAAGLDFVLFLAALDFLAAATGLRVARLAIENFSGMNESGFEGELRIQGWPEGALL